MKSRGCEAHLDPYDFDDYSRRPITFYYTQAGFHPCGHKPVYVWTRDVVDKGTARVWHVNAPESGRDVSLVPMGVNAWGRQDWMVDLTDVTEPGEYVVQVVIAGRTAETAPIPVRTDLYGRLAEKAAKHYFLKRCGIFCHTHDAYRYSLDDKNFGQIEGHRDVSGGWHDAHDDNKWVVFAWMALFGLLKAHETYRPEWKGSNEPFPYCLSEAWWEVEWLLKMQKPDGSFYHAVWEYTPRKASGKTTFPIHDPGMVHYDDLGNDRRMLVDAWGRNRACTLLGAPPGSSPSTAPKYYAYLAHVIRMFARLIRPYCADIADRCAAAAASTVAYLSDLDAYPAYQEVEVHAGLAMYHIECARDCGDAEALKRAGVLLERVLQRQQPEGHFHASDSCGGLEVYPEEAGDERVFLDYPFAYALSVIDYLDLAETLPEFVFEVEERARNALASFAAMLEAFCDGTAFGQLGEICFDREPEIILSRPRHGYNPYILSAGAVFAAAHRLLHNKGWRTRAEQQLQWVLGANPRFMCFMNQVGVRNSGQYAASSSGTMQHYPNAFYRHLRDMRWGVTTGIYGARLDPRQGEDALTPPTPQPPNYPHAGMSMSGVYDGAAQETWLNATGWFLMLLAQLGTMASPGNE